MLNGLINVELAGQRSGRHAAPLHLCPIDSQPALPSPPTCLARSTGHASRLPSGFLRHDACAPRGAAAARAAQAAGLAAALNRRPAAEVGAAGCCMDGQARTRVCFLGAGAQCLPGFHPGVTSSPSAAISPCSEEDADKAHRRIQRLRAFHFGASQFVGALQAFLHARTAGGRHAAVWVGLLKVGGHFSLTATMLLCDCNTASLPLSPPALPLALHPACFDVQVTPGCTYWPSVGMSFARCM